MTAAKTVLIMGATRGIGLKFVEHYVKLGWNVIGAARDLAKADQVQCSKRTCVFTRTTVITC